MSACPSCNGTGWAVIMAGTLCVASGLCRCKGGLCWAIKKEPRK